MCALARPRGKKCPCVLYPTVDRLHRHITTGVHHCLQEVLLCVGVAVIHSPLSSREKFLNQIQKRTICWQKKNGQPGVVIEPGLSQIVLLCHVVFNNGSPGQAVLYWIMSKWRINHKSCVICFLGLTVSYIENTHTAKCRPV